MLAGAIIVSILCYAVGGTGDQPARGVSGPPFLVHSIMAAGASSPSSASSHGLRNLLQVSPRRVWALASQLQGSAARVFSWPSPSSSSVSSSLAGSSAKPEHQLATYVEFVFTVMSFFLILIAVLLASFGIPTDLKTQTMYRSSRSRWSASRSCWRCVGYVMLMTAVLVVMSA